jgi:ribulose-5-phosphate 4-epimerase/fuculose-1-phosphate aldolase
VENGGKPVTQFRTEFVSDELVSDPRLEELKHWCSEFHRLNLAPLYPGGSYGNLSFRVKPGSNEFVITASGLALKDNLTDDFFVLICDVDLKGQVVWVRGRRVPSSESMLHHAVYAGRPDVNAVFHGHGNLKPGLPETAKEEQYGSLALVNSVIPLIARHDLIVLKRHGFLSLGKDLAEAGRRVVKALTH